jgi:bifunctional non-homologous end joining protein LigD
MSKEPSNRKLKSYRTKRKFNTTPEPAGKHVKKNKHPIFVVQKHDARHLHYDVRLEINGVLKSWAVPKGPPRKLGEKRLAIETEDHPYEYATFEGIIPKGNYGAGTVEIWDKGTFYNLKEKNGLPIPLTECFDHGSIEVYLEGTKLKGPYALVRTKLSTETKHEWLMLKMKKGFLAK